ncbi:ribonuclease E inhibitor RraA/Dimethylmenaquinone methyltransferase [Lyophyllum atratum]|nr:ribonuclease E inhibitor RraA/Dimethylmenaquinone methyltransferase [Lyophyllum atratum]
MSSSSALVEFSTCEVSDALIKLGLAHGGYIPDISMMSPPTSGPRICAPAYTVRMVATSDATAPKLSAHFVDTAPAGSIIVIDAPIHAKNAVWGGLMSAGAQARSAVGVIISGRCRDLAEHETLEFPVFARGHSTLGSSPFTRPSEINIPLIIQSQENISTDDSLPPVKVEPGDWMLADRDGVVCVPKGLESQAIELATKGRATDDLCMRDIQAGMGVEASFKAHRGK